MTIYVDEIEVIKSKEHNKDITLDKDMTFRMKYPSLNQFIENNFDVEDSPQTTVNKTFQLVADCMETVFTKEDAWDSNDYSPEERMQFIEQLSSKQFKEVEKFFATMPKLSHTIEVTNPNTKKKSSIVLEGLCRFFRLSIAREDLEAYYRINFALMQYHKYSLTEIENMMPWEREIYLTLLQEYIENEKLNNNNEKVLKGMDEEEILRSSLEQSTKSILIVFWITDWWIVNRALLQSNTSLKSSIKP